MARKKAVRRENGSGTIEKTKSKNRPYKAKVPIGTKVDKKGKVQAVYKSLGTFSTRRQAEDALADFLRTPYDLSNSVKTFSDLYETWSASYFASLSGESSIRTITCAYAYCSGLYVMPVRKIAPGHIRDAMEKGYVIPTSGKDKGKKRYASPNTGALQDEIKKKARGKVPFTTQQVLELWEFVDDIPFVDMVLIALYTGFRPQELATLEIKNIYLNENKIIGGMKTKNGRDRVVPIHPAIRHLIVKRYVQASERYRSDRLYNDPKGQQSTKMTYDMYRGRFTNVMNEMGFTGLTPHCTRHTFSTQAKRCGMDSGIRKRIMGHSLSGDVTESVYTHPTFEDLTEEMKKLDYSVLTYV